MNIEIKLKKLKEIVMTEKERSIIRTQLVNISKVNSISNKKIKSPYSSFMWHCAISFAVFVIIVGSGTGISYGATYSLPGDILYSVKVNVNEEVAGIFIKSPKEKLIYSNKRLQKRITELKTLKESGTLTPEKTAIATKNIDIHIEDMNKNAELVAKTEPEVVKEIAKSINENVEVEAKILDKIEIVKDGVKTDTIKKDGVKTSIENTKVENILIPKEDSAKTTTGTTTSTGIKKEAEINKAEIKEVVKVEETVKEKLETEKLLLEALTKDTTKTPTKDIKLQVKSDEVKTNIIPTIPVTTPTQ